MSDEIDGSEYSEMYACMYVYMRTTNWRKLSGYDFFYTCE